MLKLALQRISAFTLLGMIGISTIPSCVLRIETGTGEGLPAESNATSTGNTSGGGGQAGGNPVFTPEEEAAFADLANSNPEGAAGMGTGPTMGGNIRSKSAHATGGHKTQILVRQRIWVRVYGTV